MPHTPIAPPRPARSAGSLSSGVRNRRDAWEEVSYCSERCRWRRYSPNEFSDPDHGATSAGIKTSQQVDQNLTKEWIVRAALALWTFPWIDQKGLLFHRKKEAPRAPKTFRLGLF